MSIFRDYWTKPTKPNKDKNDDNDTDSDFDMLHDFDVDVILATVENYETTTSQLDQTN